MTLEQTDLPPESAQETSVEAEMPQRRWPQQ
jgi:hypothetical protein